MCSIDNLVHRVATAAEVSCELVGSWVLVAEIVKDDGTSGFFLLTPADQESDETEAVLKMALA